MGRHWLPVSALIKAGGHQWTLESFPILAARGFDFVTPIAWVLKPFPETVRVVSGPLALGILTLALAWSALRAGGPSARSLGRIWAVLGLTGLAQLIVLSGMGAFATYGVWYQSPYFIFCALTVAMATEELVRWALNRALLKETALRRAAILAAVLYGAFTAAWFVRLARDNDYREDSIFYTCYRVSQWLRENTRETDVVASFNAGELGYFSGRILINLDGLVNDYSYYRDVILGGANLREYLAANHVKYFVDHSIPSDLLEGTRVVYSLPHRTDHLYQVLDVSIPPRSP